jgi:uncharacterized protein YbjT (DUF2867 family)
MSNPILVSGATGSIGSALVSQLAAAGLATRALVRDPQRAAAIAGEGVEIVQGDLGDPTSLDAAFAGVTRAFLLSAADPRQEELQGNFVAAAQRAGVDQVVKLSVMGAGDDSPVALARWHRSTEKLLERSGLAWTHLRPGFFMQNLFMFAPSIAEAGVFHAPLGDAKLSLIDARDIAAVALRALTEPGHAGKVYELYGPEAQSYGEIAAIMSRVLGRPVSYQDIPEEAARGGMLDAGMPDWIVDDLIKLQAVARKGYMAGSGNLLRSLLGREPADVANFLADHAMAFRAQASKGSGA